MFLLSDESQTFSASSENEKTALPSNELNTRKVKVNMEKVRVAVVKLKLLGPGAKGRVDIEKVRMTVEKVKIMNTQK